MLDELFHLPEDEAKPLPLGEWFYALIMCPSQCYYRIQHKGVDFMLYLRWRHEGPWHAYVIRNAASLEGINKGNPVWSEDIFELYHIEYDEDELDVAKEKIISLFYEFNGDFPKRNLPPIRREFLFYLSSFRERGDCFAGWSRYSRE
jgi:hypothetical protein